MPFPNAAAVFFPTASNSPPTFATANVVGDIGNPGPNVANWALGANWNSQAGNVTTVGSAGPLSESFYGTSDQAGNVAEWNESLVGGTQRVWRGGFAGGVAIPLAASFRLPLDPSTETVSLGFRVAAVPEPNSLTLAVIGLAGGFLGWRRRRAS